MAEHQRIHPIQDPGAPLVNRASLRSDKGDPEQHQEPSRIQRTIPHAYSKPPRSNCCCRCLCWMLCLVLLLIIVLAVLAVVVYFVFQPKLPKYSIDGLRITQFNLNNDMNLYATFNMNVTANNPNTKIGIYYESGSSLRAYYKGTQLCEGSLPKFHQGHRNITELSLTLTGQTQNATDLLQSMQAQQQQTGSIPLNLRAKVPVRLKLGALKLMKWNFLVKCLLDVDSLSADNVVSIRDNSCKFRFRL